MFCCLISILVLSDWFDAGVRDAESVVVTSVTVAIAAVVVAVVVVVVPDVWVVLVLGVVV